MMAFWQQRTKNGNLPHLTYMDCKPEDLWVELKAACDTEAGILLHLEIQRGAEAMQGEEFCDRYQIHAACTTRLMKESKQSENQGGTETFLGDTWFGSVYTCLAAKKEIGANFIGVIKNNRNQYPKIGAKRK